MAQLDVQPRKHAPTLRIIIGLIIIAILFGLYKGCYETKPNASIPHETPVTH